MIAQSVPGARGPWETGKEAGAPLFCPREDQIIDLQMVLCMNYRQTVPVYRHIRTIHLTTVFHRQTRGDFNSELRARDPSKESLAVGSYHLHSLKSLGLL